MIILDLPDEIICKILSYFPLSFCLQSLSKVCKSWQFLCNSILPWTDIQLGEGNFIHDEETIYKIVKHSRDFKTFNLSNNLEMYMPINGLTLIVNNFFHAPKLQELNLSYTNISSLDFLKWSPLLQTLILKHCLQIPTSTLLTLSNYVPQLSILDISYCQLMSTLEPIVMGLPQLQEVYAYDIPISQSSLSRILQACAFDKLQVLGAHCEPGRRTWEYVHLIVVRYPDFVLKLKEYEDDISSVVSYPSGSD